MTDTTDNAARRRAANRLVVELARHGAPWVWVLSLTALALAVGEVALPTVLGRAIDATLHHSVSNSWVTWLALLIAALVVFDALDDLASGATVARSTAWLRRTLVRRVLTLEPREVERFGAGELSGRLVGNAAHAGRVAPDLVRTVANVIPSVGATVALALIDPWLCVTFLIGLPLLVILTRRFVGVASDHAERYLDVQGRIAGRLADAISGRRTIAAAGTTDREARRVLEPLPELRRHGLGSWSAQRGIGAQDALIVPLLELAVLGVAGIELVHGRITLGQFAAAGQYVSMATGLGALPGFAARLVNIRAAAARETDVLAVAPRSYGSAHLREGAGQLEFRGVGLHDGERAVLDGVDLVVPAGAMAAVVGRSGAGKSALAALAGRLVDPTAGEVRLDGVALAELSHDELRCAVSYGFAAPALFGETVLDAIRFGVGDPSPTDALEAARAARASEFIERMPKGYRTPLAEAPMSGGEVQRLGLARTFANAGRLLILDDVAASLDTVTEHEIAAVLTGALSDRTRLVVAHRASMAARSDIVAWLDGGRLRAVATHAELWADADYRELFAPPLAPTAPTIPLAAAAGALA